MATRIPDAARNAAADAVVDRADAGAGAAVLEIRTGGQPADADDAATGTLLATITLNDPAFGAAAAGVATADVDPLPTDTGDAAGTAGWFRIKDSAGATVLDGSITATGGGGDLELDNVSIAVGQVVNLNAFTYTVPASE